MATSASEPDYSTEMRLPAGKTCGDCIHTRRCVALFGHTEADTACDFYPSRYAPRTSSGGGVMVTALSGRRLISRLGCEDLRQGAEHPGEDGIGGGDEARQLGELHKDSVAKAELCTRHRQDNTTGAFIRHATGASTSVSERVRPIPQPLAEAQLATALSADRLLPIEDARRMARDIAHDLAMPITELLATAWRGVSDHVLFDTPFEGVKPGAEASSTALYALVLGYAAVQLRSHPAALDAARAHLAQERG